VKATISQVLAALLIPISAPEGWQNLTFRSLPANTVHFASDGLTINVNHSASPLIYPLTKIEMITGFKVDLEVTGELNQSESHWPQDAYLRIGLVATGEKRINRVERLFVAKWIETLFKLAPKDQGIDKIYFYSLYGPAAAQPGEKRILPGSKDLILEQLVQSGATASFAFTLPKPLPVAALWISTDGDNTKSIFQVKIKQLQIEKSETPNSAAKK